VVVIVALLLHLYFHPLQHHLTLGLRLAA